MPASLNSIYHRVGVTQFPYSDTDVDDTQLAITDAAQETLIGLFKAAINDELTNAFQKAAAGTPLAGKLPVQDIWPGQLSPQVMKQRKTDFPLLAVYQLGPGEWTERTLGVDQLTRRWGIDYVMGPLDVADVQRIGRMPHRVGVLLQMVLRQRGHKAYQGGAIQWGVPEAGSLASTWWDSHEAGQAKFASDEDGVVYHAMSAQITTTEVDSFVEGIDPEFSGTTFTFGVGGSDGILADEVVAITEVPLQIG